VAVHRKIHLALNSDNPVCGDKSFHFADSTPPPQNAPHGPTATLFAKSTIRKIPQFTAFAVKPAGQVSSTRTAAAPGSGYERGTRRTSEPATFHVSLFVMWALAGPNSCSDERLQTSESDRWSRQQVVAKTRIPWCGFGGAGAACTRQRSSSAVSFPCSATKFPASARPIPCLIATGIPPQCLGFIPDSTALQDAERQERTISLHFSLLQGTQPSIDQIANASWLTCRA
jgi:hypothetical protein